MDPKPTDEQQFPSSGIVPKAEAEASDTEATRSYEQLNQSCTSHIRK
jgi:hypothetical protein